MRLAAYRMATKTEISIDSILSSYHQKFSILNSSPEYNVTLCTVLLYLVTLLWTVTFNFDNN